MTAGFHPGRHTSGAGKGLALLGCSVGSARSVSARSGYQSPQTPNYCSCTDLPFPLLHSSFCVPQPINCLFFFCPKDIPRSLPSPSSFLLTFILVCRKQWPLLPKLCDTHLIQLSNWLQAVFDLEFLFCLKNRTLIPLKKDILRTWNPVSHCQLCSNKKHYLFL